jgi:hypothetical protein
MACLKGNHETLVTHFQTGLEDLAAEFVQRFPDTHRRFVSGLPIAFTCGDFLFVHAEVRPGIAWRSSENGIYCGSGGIPPSP